MVDYLGENCKKCLCFDCKIVYQCDLIGGRTALYCSLECGGEVLCTEACNDYKK